MNKSALKSKTMWFGLATALAPLFPSFGAFMADNAAMLVSAWGIMAMILRMVTKDKIILLE